MSFVKLARRWNDNLDAALSLRSCGIRRRLAAFFVTGPYLYIATIAVSAFLAWAMNSSHEIPSFFTTVFVVLLGIQQWRTSKTEAALDKFYDRLNLTNERLRIWRNPRAFISRDWNSEETFEMEMYVCLELDNLEYVIQKYERGYMEPRDALRELTCFSSRCHAGEFREVAVRVGTRGRV